LPFPNAIQPLWIHQHDQDSVILRFQTDLTLAEWPGDVVSNGGQLAAPDCYDPEAAKAGSISILASVAP